MTQITEISRGARATDTRIISLVCAAHFVSHFYILVLPPLFPFIRDYYGVSYTQLGFALTAFNVTTALCQTPAGFLVDRVGARSVLVCGLVLGAICLAIVGLIPSFWLLVAMFALFGVANGVYHPADYAILSQLVSQERASQAFSLHIFAGFLGTAVTPATMLILQSVLGWQGAFVAASMCLLVAIALGRSLPRCSRRRRSRGLPARKGQGGCCAAVRTDPAQSSVLRDDHVLDHRRADYSPSRSRGVWNADRHRQHGPDANLMLTRSAFWRRVLAARVGRPNGSRPVLSRIALTGAVIGIWDLGLGC